MGLQGYVGNSADQQRIRRQEKQREQEKKKFEELKAASDANVDKAGLRLFGAGNAEVYFCSSRTLPLQFGSLPDCSTFRSAHAEGVTTCCAGLGGGLQKRNGRPGDKGGVL